MLNRSGKKRPRDVNQIAKSIVDLVTGNPITEDVSPIAGKERNPLPVPPAFGQKARAEERTKKK